MGQELYHCGQERFDHGHPVCASCYGVYYCAKTPFAEYSVPSLSVSIVSWSWRDARVTVVNNCHLRVRAYLRLLPLKSALLFSNVESFGASKTRTEKLYSCRGFMILLKMFRSNNLN